MTNSTLGLRTTGLAVALAAAAAVLSAWAAALACTALAIWAVFTTLEKELRNVPEEAGWGGGHGAAAPAAADAAAGGCWRLSVAGEAGELVELQEPLEPDGLCKSIM